jgi:hypothetical protein
MGHKFSGRTGELFEIQLIGLHGLIIKKYSAQNFVSLWFLGIGECTQIQK